MARQKKIVKDIVGKHGGMLVGKGPGALYDQKKFDTSYTRDLLLDRGASPSLSSTTASIRSVSTSRSRMQSSRRSLTRAAQLSHHHAVGTEHAAWLEQDISAPDVHMIEGLFSAIDPNSNFNPGKIIAK